MAKRRPEVPVPTLASLWNRPSPSSSEGDFGQPVACVATTYTFHASLLEGDLLSRFLGLRFDASEKEKAFVVEREQALAQVRVSVLVDQAHVDRQQTTLRWDQLPVRVPGGLQHAKVTLLLWERCLRLIVASANLTRPGYRRNREMAAALDFFDGPDSVPREVARDAIGFLRELEPWVGGVREARERWLGSLQDAEARLRTWSNAPEAFGPREYPRVSFVGGRPGVNGRRPRSPLEAVAKLWTSTRPVDRFVVMTPFVGDGDLAPLLDRVQEMFPNQPYRVQLVIPEGPAPEKGPRVAGLPSRLRDAWFEYFPGSETLLVRRGRKDENVERALHAKAMLMVRNPSSGGPGLTLLLCGSSNFSPHGLGIGQPNVEANLCYLARPDTSGQGLESRLPVDWDADAASNVVWPKDVEPAGEDEEKYAQVLPAALLGATYDQRTSLIGVRFDEEARTEAETWRFSLPSPSGASDILRSREGAERPGELSFRLTDEQSQGAVTVLRVGWRCEEGAREGLLPLQVVSAEALLPVEELRNLSADAIVASLLSGRDVSELMASEAPLFGSRQSNGKDVQASSLQANDPSQYTLYRVRRQSRAVTALGEKLCEGARTPEALRYRLLLDPLGPLRLAEALVAPLKAAPDPGPAETEPVVFMLAELALVLGHVARRVRKESTGVNGDVRTVFRETVSRVLELAAPYRGSLPKNLAQYLQDVDAEIRPWLGGEVLLAY
ncbi:MAG: hypothetical protein KJ067_20845 [Vicinamibacteria bacterium]|nr:hypothetical protein [Vicinamibacteria bacterium]